MKRRVPRLQVLVLGVVVTLLGMGSSEVRAEEQVAAVVAEKPTEHALYVELFGKGGLYGLGYDVQPWRRIALGASASYYVLDAEVVATLSPYVTVYPLGVRRHRAFVQTGPQLAYLLTRSPVPEWPGQREIGVGAHLSAGYEYRRGVLVRVFGMGFVGRGGIAPWVGVSLGWTL